MPEDDARIDSHGQAHTQLNSEGNLTNMLLEILLNLEVSGEHSKFRVGKRLMRDDLQRHCASSRLGSCLNLIFYPYQFLLIFAISRLYFHWLKIRLFGRSRTVHREYGEDLMRALISAFFTPHKLRIAFPTRCFKPSWTTRGVSLLFGIGDREACHEDAWSQNMTICSSRMRGDDVVLAGEVYEKWRTLFLFANFASSSSTVSKFNTNWLASMDAFTAAQTTELCARIGTKKSTMRLDKLFFNSVMTGPLLGFGCAVLLSTEAAPWYQENAPGLIRTIAALTFPIGLVMIVLTGSDLFTSNVMVC